MNGEMKARYEWNTNGGISRFNVRNARLRFTGYVSDLVWYRFFLDFNDNGNLTILDTYVTLCPGAFEFVFGQQRADLDRSVNPYFFANRSLLIKYLPTNCAVSHDGRVMADIQGWRDIGISGGYTFGKGGSFPVRIGAGAFNGSGMRNPVYSRKLSWSVRMEAGRKMDGIHCYAWYYDGWLASQERRVIDEGTGLEIVEKFRQKTRMAAAGMYYCADRLYLEGEYGTRFPWEDVSVSETMHTAYFQWIYSFPLSIRLFKYAAPAFRWDIAANIPFRNVNDSSFDMLSTNRLTFGMNMGLTEKLMVSELRLNFEKFLFRKEPSDLADNPLFQDKLTLELCIQF